MLLALRIVGIPTHCSLWPTDIISFAAAYVLLVKQADYDELATTYNYFRHDRCMK